MADDSPARQSKKLPDRELAFVRAYLAGPTRGRALQSAHAAGFSENDTGIGTTLLQRPRVRRAIDKRLRRADVRVDRVLAELTRIAYSDMRNYADWGPDGITLKSSEELSDLEAAAVAELSETTTKEGGSVKFKLHDKMAALTTLAKHLRIVDGDGVGDAQRPLAIQINITAPGALPDADAGSGPSGGLAIRFRGDPGNGRAR